jgi:hypothetical protein
MEIQVKIDRNKIEGIFKIKVGVKDMNNPFFPSHFLCVVCGWPGIFIVY